MYEISSIISHITKPTLYGFFFFVAAVKHLYWVYLWQLKEYRTDRMMDFFSTHSGKKASINYRNIIECLFLIMFILITSVFASELFALVVLFAWLFFLILELFIYARWRVYPVWTLKAIIIFALSLLSTICLAIILGTLINLGVSTTASLILIPLIVSSWVFIFQPVTTIQKKRIIQEAKEKLDSLQPIVIGITGSYGKSSTKEYLNTILSQKYNVLTTPKNVNVDIGVAQTIIDQLKPEHDIFIVEMGAYKKGEIQAICDIVSPIIGVLVAINEQHLALFGSLEVIKQTKAELLQSLPDSGLAAINRDNDSCLQAAEDCRAVKKYFSTVDKAHGYISDLIVNPREIRMMLHIGDKQAPTRTRLHGQQVIPAILAASVVADHIGMSIDEIAKGIELLKPVNGTMCLRNGYNHSLIIDDHYNSNPDGFLAAVDYLRLFTDKRKIIITPGMQELGTESDLHHRNVGNHAGDVADMLYITKNDFAKPLKSAAKNGGLQEHEIIVNGKPNKIIKMLSDITDNDVILIEGRIHKSILNFLISE